jgi:hypothetical protein
MRKILWTIILSSLLPDFDSSFRRRSFMSAGTVQPHSQGEYFPGGLILPVPGYGSQPHNPLKSLRAGELSSLDRWTR